MNAFPASNESQLSNDISGFATWSSCLAKEKSQEYFKNILAFLEQEYKKGKTIYPQKENIFNALKLTSLDKVRVVILGQDPYHGPRQAHGLCFSVLAPTPPPPSLQNIYKELHADIGFQIPNHGDLTPWTSQGVLLLNTTLTVEAGKAASHANIGWERFTDSIIANVSSHLAHVVFLLWGSHAIKKKLLIDENKHTILTAPHPSPLSAHRGFLGCRHFSKANKTLEIKNQETVDWSL
jgi:uracil-DNA glycosylase